MIDKMLDHVGIVVPNLDRAMEALSAHLGIEWMGVFDPTLPMRDAERGTRDVSLHIALGPAQPPRLELIEAIPGSPWQLDDDRMLLHHLAYYVDDLRADSRSVAGPCPIEIEGVGEAGDIPRTFTYHLHDGLRFELLERREMPLA
jgi:catechol 2,3-dioxygenase-like lactoylglutathione lyase family enzyme